MLAAAVTVRQRRTVILDSMDGALDFLVRFIAGAGLAGVALMIANRFGYGFDVPGESDSADGSDGGGDGGD